MFKCPKCSSEKFVNSVGPAGMIRTCRNPLCSGLENPSYSFTSDLDEFHTKEAVEAAQKPVAAPVVEAKPTPTPVAKAAKKASKGAS